MNWVKFSKWINYLAGASLSVIIGILVIVILTGGHYWNWEISFLAVPLGLLAGAIGNRLIMINKRFIFLVASFFLTIYLSTILTIFGWSIFVSLTIRFN